jgi:hypothetical protein
MVADAGTEPSPDRLPVTAEQWRAYLTEYSDWYLRVTGLTVDDVGDYDPRLPELNPVTRQQVSARWLGHEPASEEAIAAAEERLGVRLPPSLRGFLLVSDGWGPVSEWTDALLPCDQLDWFSHTHPGFFPDGAGGIPDDDDGNFEFFANCLNVARGEDAFLLDTTAVSADGEYEAYLFAVKYGDPGDALSSFSALIAEGRAEIASTNEDH